MKNINLQAISLAALLIFPDFSQAALVVEDLNSAGDGLVTYDDVSGLRWLDLTETRGLNYYEVKSELGEGGLFEGWRYATYDEAAALYSQFGFTVSAAGNDLPDEEFVGAVNLMNSYLGDLYFDAGLTNVFAGSQGLIAEPGQSDPENKQSLMYAFYQQYQDSSGQDAYVLYQMLGGNGSIPKSLGQPTRGSLLVATPIPASFYLFATAISLLFSLRRKYS